MPMATKTSTAVHLRTPQRWLRGVIGILALAALTLTSAQGQTVYRIVGPDGRVTFSDKPPVTTGKVTPLDAKAQSSGAGGAALSYELRQVVSKFPVTLYTSKECAPCDSGRSLLRARGVPFTEKNVSTAEDSDAFQRLSGTGSLPFLTVGGQQIKGYSDSEWSQYLNAAGYPESNKLPTGYRNPAPTPLVEIQTPVSPSQTSNAPAKIVQPSPPPTLRVTPGNPAGIQF